MIIYDFCNSQELVKAMGRERARKNAGKIGLFGVHFSPRQTSNPLTTASSNPK
jgi:hypothetical protein